jgi:hypothetical protein
MATAMFALDFSKEQEFADPEEEVAACEEALRIDVQQGSSRLLESHRQELEAEIEQARAILDHPDAVDEHTYSIETLDRSVAFLQKHIESAWRSYAAKAPIPTIGPGPSGSVDLYWKQPYWKLLVNIPSDASASATFYGDDYARHKTKGSLDPNEISVTILAWLMS